MSILEGVGLLFDETMSGKVAVGEGAADVPVRFDLRIQADDLHRFLHLGDHRARAEGTLTFAPLGGTMAVREGAFWLFRPDPDSARYHLVYRLGFDGRDGRYTLTGEKTLQDDPGFDMVEDMTRMPVTIWRGAPESGAVFATGEMRFDLADLPRFIGSVKVTGARTPWAEVAARVAFLSFALGTLREEYLKGLSPTYDTGYENLVVQGTARCGLEERPFFLVTGVHDRGFPWGDGEVFWDVLLLLGDGAGGWRRFAITDRILEGMELDVAKGLSRYAGKVFELPGPRASFSQMRRGEGLAARAIELDLRFRASARAPVGFPFRELSAHLPSWTTRLADAVHELLPSTHPLGIWITPHSVAEVQGGFRLTGGAADEAWTVESATAVGEAERATFRNVREPTLLYHYLCALDPRTHADRVQIDARTMRDERIDYVKDHLDKLVGALVTRMASAEIELTADGREVRPLRGAVPDSSDVAERLVKLETLLQIDNDHFPTAVFQRNVVRVADRQGASLLALEEDMRSLRLEPIGSTEVARVAAIHDDDKRRALDHVIAETGFDVLLDRALAASGKAKADFLVALKPNFMFSYSKHDPSTFTDPELVAYLARRLVDRGYTRVKVVEAQSSYGEYFDKRSVAEMAEYLGYSGKDEGGPLYEVVDLTLDVAEERDFGPALGVHPVPRTWRDADFRISFAKNKTHAYAYYTLALKNVYGALPLAAKFKEYHCKRGIYRTTMEYLAAFPVHFAFIDAYLSADGPFGVFADPLPNATHTVIGGPNLVAVDWVGATKMGIDPMISPYMRLAVERFGKPEIDFVGDASVYRPWLNVPPALTWFTHHVIDADFATGNLFYAVMANMDSERFAFKDTSAFFEVARALTKPMRDMFFVQTGERPSLGNRAAAWLQAKLGS